MRTQRITQLGKQGGKYIRFHGVKIYLKGE